MLDFYHSFMQWTYVQKIKARFKTCKKRFARFYADVNFLAFNKNFYSSKTQGKNVLFAFFWYFEIFVSYQSIIHIQFVSIDNCHLPFYRNAPHYYQIQKLQYALLHKAPSFQDLLRHPMADLGRQTKTHDPKERSKLRINKHFSFQYSYEYKNNNIVAFTP